MSWSSISALIAGNNFSPTTQALTKNDIRPSFIPYLLLKSSWLSFLIAIIPDISTSLKVVNIAAFSWACFNLFAIVCLKRVILILSSSPYWILLWLGCGLAPIIVIRSPFKILPALPVPFTLSRLMFFSATIFLTAGERIIGCCEVSSVSTSSVKSKGSSSNSSIDLSSVNTNGSSNLVWGFFSISKLITLLFWSLNSFSSLSSSCFLLSGTFLISTFPSEIEPNTAPTSTVSPSLKLISDNVPLIGDGTSKFTLSVSSSTIASSAWTVSPSFFNHLETVASVILSPKVGTKIFSLIN